jgi:DNA-binding HxlR family transcriptional regulator
MTRTAAGKDAINAALDLFHRRWTLRILWELRQGPLTFRQLQGAGGEISASVLSQRLAELRDALLVEHDGSGYALTAQGTALLAAFEPLQAWSLRWHAAVQRSTRASPPPTPSSPRPAPSSPRRRGSPASGRPS